MSYGVMWTMQLRRAARSLLLVAVAFCCLLSNTAQVGLAQERRDRPDIDRFEHQGVSGEENCAGSARHASPAASPMSSSVIV
jgi:hypothetical protein